MADVTVIGAGISGLASAVALGEAGHRVSIVADRWGAETTSSVAGAIWLPYLCEPPEDVIRWARATYTWLESIARESPEAGVDMLWLEESAPGDERPWWLEALPEGVPVERIGAARLRPGRPAWRLRVPRVDPEVMLAWLEGRLEGVRCRRAPVASLESCGGDVVVNCAGLGAKRLCGDGLLEARFGQVVVAEPGSWEMDRAAADETEGITYVIPRREQVILGGVSEARDAGAPAVASASIREDILARAARAGVGHGARIADRAAHRPYRVRVRVEREGRVVHNYGHGGAGWTLCRGWALDVVGLGEGAAGRA